MKLSLHKSNNPTLVWVFGCIQTPVAPLELLLSLFKDAAALLWLTRTGGPLVVFKHLNHPTPCVQTPPVSESWRRQLRISTHMPTHSSPTHSSHVTQIHSHMAQLFVIHNVLTPNTVKMEVKYTQTGESSESCPQSAGQTCLKLLLPWETQQNVRVHWFYRCDGQVFSSAAHSSDSYSCHSCCSLHWQLWNEKALTGANGRQ